MRSFARAGPARGASAPSWTWTGPTGKGCHQPHEMTQLGLEPFAGLPGCFEVTLLFEVRDLVEGGVEPGVDEHVHFLHFGLGVSDLAVVDEAESGGCEAEQAGDDDGRPDHYQSRSDTSDWRGAGGFVFSAPRRESGG